jgi:hypothetical protein
MRIFEGIVNWFFEKFNNFFKCLAGISGSAVRETLIKSNRGFRITQRGNAFPLTPDLPLRARSSVTPFSSAR